VEGSLILDFYPQNFSWRQQSIFHLKRDWRKSTKFIICNGLVCFELDWYVLN